MPSGASVPTFVIRGAPSPSYGDGPRLDDDRELGLALVRNLECAPQLDARGLVDGARHLERLGPRYGYHLLGCRMDQPPPRSCGAAAAILETYSLNGPHVSVQYHRFRMQARHAGQPAGLPQSWLWCRWTQTREKPGRIARGAASLGRAWWARTVERAGLRLRKSG